MHTGKINQMMVIVIVFFVTGFITPGFTKTFKNKDNGPSISKNESIKFLTITSRRYIENYVVSNNKEESSHHINEKKDKLLKGFDLVLANKHVPSEKELKKLDSWIKAFFKMFVHYRIYPLGSEDGKNLSVTMGLALRYLDCARHLVAEKE